MKDIIVLHNPFENKHEFVYTKDELEEVIKARLDENTTMRKVSQEEFDDYLKQAEAQEERKKLKQQVDRLYDYIHELGVFDYGIKDPFRYTPTKTTIMKGFTNAKGPKHLSKKKRKQLKGKSK